MKRQLRGKYLRGEDGSLNEWPAKCPRQYAGALAVHQCPFLDVLFLQGQYLGWDGAEGTKMHTILAPGLQTLTTCTGTRFSEDWAGGITALSY